MEENKTRGRLKPLLAVLLAVAVLAASALAPRYLLAAGDRAILSEYHSIAQRGGRLQPRFSSPELERLFLLLDDNYIEEEHYSSDAGDDYGPSPWDYWYEWEWQVIEASDMGLIPNPLAALMLELPMWGGPYTMDGIFYNTREISSRRETLFHTVDGSYAFYSFYGIYGERFGEMEFYADADLMYMLGFEDVTPRPDQLAAVLPVYQEWLEIAKVPDWQTVSYERAEYYGACTYSELAGVALLAESSDIQLHFRLLAMPLEEGLQYIGGERFAEPSAEIAAEMAAESMMQVGELDGWAG